MKSFFDKIQDSTLTWTSDDDISISSSSLSSSDFDSSDDEDDDGEDQELEHDDDEDDADQQEIQINDDQQEQQQMMDNHENVNNVEMQQALQQQIQEGNIQQHPVAPLGVQAGEEAADQQPREPPLVAQEQEAQQEANGNELIFLPVHQLSDLQRQAIAGAARHPPIRTSSTQILQRIEAHPRSNEFIMRIARCEILPLIRAEIDWKLLLTQLPTYPAQEVGDDLASFLLQSILRMTPSIPILKEIIQFFPRACVDMDPFYAACQFCNDEVVKFIIQKTISSRKEFGIKWSMVALLGDARISLKHARFLFEYKLQMFEKVEDRILDPQMGLFGVSPLDRMLSGQFIHGDTFTWVEKLKLALLAANTGNIIPNPKFYPFHTLVKRLISIDFKGNHFGQLAFINCLNACIDGDENGTPFHEVNEHWNLPLHTVLTTKCNTNLGIIGERKLVKFLLKANPDSATMKNSKGLMPIRLAIENGWPVYDIICHFCPASYTEGVIQTNLVPSIQDVGNNATPSATGTTMSFLSPGGSTNNVIEEEKDLLIHDILNGPFSDRFGISGARELIKFVLKKYPSVGMAPDANGKLPIHIAIENGWPVHDLIVGAAPHTLEVKDPVTGLYPFLLAASITTKTTTIDSKEEATAPSNAEEEKATSKSTFNADLSTLYELIREAPLMLQGFGTEHQKKNKAQMIRRRSSLLHSKRKRKHHYLSRRRGSGNGSSSPTRKKGKR